MKSSPRSWLVALAASLLATTACENAIEVRAGIIRVVVSTTGGDQDIDGYLVVIDGMPAESVGIHSTLERRDQQAGEYTVELAGVAWNCTVEAPNPRLVTVADGETVELTFQVQCVATGVQLTVLTTGIDIDPDGYRIVVDTGPPALVGVNSVQTVTYLSAGVHSVSLNGLTGNCSVADDEQSVTLAAGTVAPVTFNVACVAVTGVLRVVTATAGLDPDAGYQLQVNGGAPLPLAANGVVAVAGLLPGDHSVALLDAAANCAVSGANPRTATITAGGPARDTTHLAFAAACASVTGAVAVSVNFSGLDPDDSLSVQLDGGPAVRLPNGASLLMLPGLTVGDHEVRLADVAANCSVAGANPRTVSVSSSTTVRDTARTTFDLSCVARTGVIEVTAPTSGFDHDGDGYNVQVAGQSRSIAAAGTETFSVGTGDHLVMLSGLAPNCSVTNNPRQVSVSTGGQVRDTVRTTFAVTCAAVFGAVRFAASTSGSDLDPTGYDIRVFGLSFERSIAVAANGTALMTHLYPSAYLVEVRGHSPNCDLVGAYPRAVQVVLGDTVDMAIDVTCSPAVELAAVLDADIYRVKSNGTGLTPLASHPSADEWPAWSPGGATIAFASNRGGNRDVYVMNADGSGVVQLTSDPAADYYPTFSPDGSKIAFLSGRSGNLDIWVMNADGSSPVQLTTHSATDADPVWSPDGLKLAFWSTRDGNGDIYVMNADGSGQTRLTTDSREEVHPDWSPDGSQIVFSRLMWEYYGTYDYDLVVMNADGSNQIPLPSGSSDTDPSWSPDSQWIAFGASICDYYDGCWYQSVNAVRLDGTRLSEIVPGGYHPAWKR